MEKIQMREYLAELEMCLDKALRKWKKLGHVEDGEVVTVSWQFENSHIIMDVFWPDGKEMVHLKCFGPRQERRDHWDGLHPKTARKIMDRVGNFAQIAMDPYRK